ncbi:amino acid--tRNA ligase-related protein [Candidatus Hodgkinia cicadicola]
MFSVSCLGLKLKLKGWLLAKRVCAGVLFAKLVCEPHGTVQLVANLALLNLSSMSSVSLNSALSIEGVLKLKPSGGFEVGVLKFGVLGWCTSSAYGLLPPSVKPACLFLCYRERLERRQRLMFRSRLTNWLRSSMLACGFVELTTPLLTSRSSEGARSYLVTSATAGKLYALPQSPQVYKQLVVASGFFKYFQLAPCFRLERMARHRLASEFYQLDLECGFASLDSVMELTSLLVLQACVEFAPLKQISFGQLDYFECVRSYATDKPDLRNPLFYHKFCEGLFCVVLVEAVLNGMDVCDVVDRLDSQYRRFVLAWKLGSSVLGYHSDFICEKLKLAQTDCCVFVLTSSLETLSGVRSELGRVLGLVGKAQLCFCWVAHPPAYKAVDKALVFNANPFNDLEWTGGVFGFRSNQCDLVCNGVELASGGVRSKDLASLLKAFSLVGLVERDVQAVFPGLYLAYCSGLCQHAGLGLGLERLLMLLLDLNSVSDVVLFPSSSSGTEPLTGAPS